MHRNGIFLGFLLLLVGTTIWFGARAYIAVSNYTKLNTHAMASVEKMEIVEGKGDRYQLIANYFFESKEGLQQGVGVVGPLYKNPWSAEKGLQKFEGRTWQVWYDEEHPFNSTLNKQFPTKRVTTAVILFGLFLYFLGLGIFVGGRKDASRSHP
ncbi:MAG: hypothetical protein S4CHLAM45_10380 [Chlamydiales bacterium]|nr:hypothetical protein [Chlamydiales bacterium]MCH9619532.1 hypothetical protein [Chlamydiales bacterium]MCH9623138.1 hypothetical protein [Chlamydiales bacterium]